MHLAPLIRDLAVILAVAGVVSVLCQRIRQPVVLGYIVAGLIVGPFTPPYRIINDLPSIRIWAELGVIFLMFTLGLEFSFRKLASVGVSAGVTATFEAFFMLVLGLVTGQLSGWKPMDSLFLGAMLSVSSTTIIIKALDELGLKSRRFAEMIFGVLIVEDLLAILLLVALSTAATGKGFSGLLLLSAAGKLLLVIGSWFVAGYFVVPRLVRYVGRWGTNETLTIVSIGLCLALVVFASHFEYSVALGAFIMGSILAESTESHRIEERIESLRDLFAAVFFVSVGMLIDPRALWEHRWAVLLISLVTIVGKIVSTTLGAMLTGQSLRTSLQVGFGLAQIGEFSFIIAGMGLSLGATSDFLYPVGVAVSLVTTFTTPYLIQVSHRFAVALEERLPRQVRVALERYSAWSQERKTDTSRRKLFYRLLLKWAINGLLVTVIFVLVGEWAQSQARERGWEWSRVMALAWSAAALGSAPFVWGMLTAFRGFHLTQGGPPLGGAFFAMRLLSLVWIGALTFEFFPARYAILMMGALMGSLFLLMRRQLAASYHWFEGRFLSTFEPGQAGRTPKHGDKVDLMRHLAPWDAHLVRLKVHPNSQLAQKTIHEARVRTEYGLSIVVIRRGLRSIVAPTPDVRLLPGDEVLVLGTDEQVDRLRPALERPPGGIERGGPASDYELRALRLPKESRLLGQTIRNLGIRENFGAMVVGIERGDQRIVNPESDLSLRAEDVLLAVGEKGRLDRLSEELSK